MDDIIIDMGTLPFSSRVMMLFAAVPSPNKSPFAVGGLETYMSVDEVLSELQEIMPEVKDNSLNALIDAINNKISKKFDFEYLREIVNRLENANKHEHLQSTINELLSFLHQNKKSKNSLTKEEKESSNKFREDLLVYRKSLVSDKMIKGYSPELIEAFGMSEYELQQMKERMIKEQKEKLAKYPYIIYCHACDRLKIKPLNPDNAMNFGGDVIFSVIRATEHSNRIRSLNDALTTLMDTFVDIADDEKIVDGVFYKIIDDTVNSLKKIEQDKELENTKRLNIEHETELAIEEELQPSTLEITDEFIEEFRMFEIEREKERGEWLPYSPF